MTNNTTDPTAVPELLTSREAAAMIRCTVRFLEVQRNSGKGPVIIKMGKEGLLYPRAEFIAWVNAQRQGGWLLRVIPVALSSCRWRPLAKGSLLGFAQVRMPSGMILHDVTVHHAGAAVVGISTRAAADRSARARRGRAERQGDVCADYHLCRSRHARPMERRRCCRDDGTAPRRAARRRAGVGGVTIDDDAIVLGLPVFPCNTDKRPVTPRGLHDASTDPATHPLDVLPSWRGSDRRPDRARVRHRRHRQSNCADEDGRAWLRELRPDARDPRSPHTVRRRALRPGPRLTPRSEQRLAHRAGRRCPRGRRLHHRAAERRLHGLPRPPHRRHAAGADHALHTSAPPAGARQAAHARRRRRHPRAALCLQRRLRRARGAAERDPQWRRRWLAQLAASGVVALQDAGAVLFAAAQYSGLGEPEIKATLRSAFLAGAARPI